MVVMDVVGMMGNKEYQDVRDAFELAMRSEGINEETVVLITVDDAIDNNMDDDLEVRAPVVIYQYFDNSPRCDCCMKTIFDENYKCPDPNNYKVHGVVEWLRFVWAMNKNIKRYIAPTDFDWDQDDPYGSLGGFGSPQALLGSKEHPIDVVDSLTGESWESVEVYENFKIYLNNTTGRALIECYNPEFEDLFDSAVQCVGNEYVGEPIPHVCKAAQKYSE
jgi:hypothetical protein